MNGGPGWERLQRAKNLEAIRKQTIELQQKALREVAQRSTLPLEEPTDYPKPKGKKK